MISTAMIFLFISGIFFIGFFGNLLFRKTKISDIFFLLIIGVLLGSGLHLISSSQIGILKTLAPLFGAIALIILMFDGGLHLNLYKVIKELGKASMFTILTFLLTMGFSGVFLKFVFGMPLIYGFMIGAIIGGVSSAVVIPLIKESKAKESIKTILTLESAITDALCIIVTIAMVEIIVSKTTGVQFITQSILSAFAIGAVIGIAAGIFWLKILERFKSAREYDYLLTLSFLFLMYVFIEFAKGNGAFGVLMFGLVLGNGREVLKILKMKEFEISKTITIFQSEISLFVKTFFLIYLGIIVDVSGLNLKIILMVIGLLVLALGARILSMKVIMNKNSKIDKNYIFSSHARGLAAAVLATYPLTMGVVNKYTIAFPVIAFLIIILTNLTTTIFFFVSEKSNNVKQKKEEGKTIKELIKTNDVLNPVVK